MKRLKIYMSIKPIFPLTRISHFQIVMMGFLFVLMLNVLIFFSFQMTYQLNHHDEGENRTLDLILYDADTYDLNKLMRDISEIKSVESIQHSAVFDREINISILLKDYRLRYDTIEALPKDIKHIGIVTHKIESAIGFFKWVKLGGMFVAVMLLIILMVLIKRTLYHMVREHTATFKVIHVVGYNGYQQALLWTQSLFLSYVILLILTLGIQPLFLTLFINPIMEEISIFEAFGIKIQPNMMLNMMGVVLYGLICTHNMKTSVDKR